MRVQNNTILKIDAWANLLLGILILCFPVGIDNALGLPDTTNYFYTSILGAIILGIGIALFIDLKQGSGGLGLLGAIAINLSGGLVLFYWLVFGCMRGITTTGLIILWFLCVLVIGIGIVELLNQPWKGTHD